MVAGLRGECVGQSHCLCRLTGVFRKFLCQTSSFLCLFLSSLSAISMTQHVTCELGSGLSLCLGLIPVLGRDSTSLQTVWCCSSGNVSSASLSISGPRDRGSLEELTQWSLGLHTSRCPKAQDAVKTELTVLLCHLPMTTSLLSRCP